MISRNFFTVLRAQCTVWKFRKFSPTNFFYKISDFFSSSQRTKGNNYKTSFTKLKIFLFCGNLRRCLQNKSCRTGFGLLETIETCRTSADAMGVTNAWSLHILGLHLLSFKKLGFKNFGSAYCFNVQGVSFNICQI